MAVNQIPISNAADKPWAQLLLQYRQQLVSYRQQQAIIKQQGAAVLGKLTAMVDGANYSQLESQLGLQAGQGDELFNELNSVVGNFRDTDSTATVNAAIDQFVNWIG